jgi:small multidrug resistance pump
MAYLYLAIAILTEVTATSALKASKEFTNLMPSLIVIVGYGMSFYFMTLALRSIPLGITYAVWSGIGIVLIAIAGVFLYQEIPDLPAMIGMGLIISGVIIIHLFSKTVGH